MAVCRACETAAADDAAAASVAPPLLACVRLGHVREEVNFGVQIWTSPCALCKESVNTTVAGCSAQQTQPEGWWGAKVKPAASPCASPSARDDVCQSCGATEAGQDFIRAKGLQWTSYEDVRGVNEVWGPGPFFTWVPILLEDEGSMAWVNVGPAPHFPVMVSICDNHGREGYFGLKLSVLDFVAKLSTSSLVDIVENRGLPTYYG